MRHKSEDKAVEKANRIEVRRRRRRQARENAMAWCEKKINHMVPPGFEWKPIVKWAVAGMGICSVISMFRFMGRYGKALQSLKWVKLSKSITVINEGEIIQSFSWVMKGVMAPFVYLMAIILLLTIFHYLYYYHGSKSIYLMKRLPNRSEIHRRSLSLPLILVAACVVVIVLLTAACCGWYYLWVPDRCIAPGQLSHFLREGIFTMWRGDGL